MRGTVAGVQDFSILNRSHQQEFANAMQADGIFLSELPIDDGQVKRFRIEGDKAGSKNGWYCLYGDGVPAGSYGSWKTGESFTWCAKSSNEMSESERAAHRKRTEAAKQQRKAEHAKVQREAAIACAALWAEASTMVDADHPYVVAKGVQAIGIRQHKKALLVPVRDKDGKLTSLQFISPDGSKRFKSGGKVRGCYTSIGKPTETVYIAEGYATAVTIHEATGSIVVVAFNAGNLDAVTEAIKTKYPDKTLIVCADNDTETEGNPGIEKAKLAAAQQRGIGWTYPDFDGGKGDFNDLFLLRGLDAVTEQLVANLHSTQPEGTATLPSDSRPRSSYADRFKVSDTGVYFKDDNDEWVFICSTLEVTAITRDRNGLSFGRLLEWMDVDDVRHCWAMPMSLLAGDGLELRKELLDSGLPHIGSGPKPRKLLMDYISTSSVTDRARCVEKTGWHNDCFVFPDAVIGDQTGERVILQTVVNSGNHFREAGTLEQWQQHIARYCVGNSRLVFAVSVAFAAPLLDLISTDGGGFNLRGNSSEGKTTALKVAASVCGGSDYVQTWRATGNGLEGISASHNDTLLALDEMGQVDPKEAGETAYMLANGQGKARAGRSGDSRPRRHWRILFLSTGEISLGDHLRTIGKDIKAGQEVRLADIPMDTGVYGGFEQLHGMESGAEFSDSLSRSAAKYHGVPLRAYLASIVSKRIDIGALIKDVQGEFRAKYVPAGSVGQVSRVADRFGLVAAGGELATSAGITGWTSGEATQAAATCFKAWLAERGGIGSREDQKALSQVVTFFQRFGQSRFAAWNGTGQERINDRAGFIQLQGGETLYFLFPNIFRQEVCKGHNYKAVAKLLSDKCLLLHEEGRHTVSKKPPNEPRSVRFYCIKGGVIDD